MANTNRTIPLTAPVPAGARHGVCQPARVATPLRRSHQAEHGDAPNLPDPCAAADADPRPSPIPSRAR